MIIYLDNCAFNRPFDDQSQIRIRIETEAKLFVQREIKEGRIDLIWSYLNESENADNPFLYRKNSIDRWKDIAKIRIIESQTLLTNSKNLLKLGLRPKDALHLACAIEGKAEFFLTTDDGILRKSNNYSGVMILNPVDFIGEIERNDY